MPVVIPVEPLSPVTASSAAPFRVMCGHHVGAIVGLRDRGWVIDFPENPHGPLAARTTLALDAEAVRRAAETRGEVLLVFERERSDLPIVVGLLTPPPAADLAGPLAVARLAAVPGAPRPTEAIVDGERVVFTASQEIVLRCGKASIHLLSDGSVRIRGTQLLSRASGTNRIRGGNVQIN